MVAVVLYSLAAIGGAVVLGCAVLLIACVRIAHSDCANDGQCLPSVVPIDTSHDPRNAEYAGPRLYKSEVRR
jgi:hypothetical protein